MFGLSSTAELASTVGAYSNNLSVFYYEPKFITYVAVCGKNQINFLQWDSKFELMKSEEIILKDKDTGSTITAIQCKICAPADRNLPVLVVTSVDNIRIFDVKDLKLLISVALEKPPEVFDNDESDELPPDFNCEWYKLSRGITCVDNNILVGMDNGEIMFFACNGESTISIKKPLVEHKAPIISMATCIYDNITVSADVEGVVNVWGRSLKQVTKKISTAQCISVINILRKHALCGTYRGQILMFNVLTGELMAEVTAHAREITSISVAPESAYMLTGSHDGNICIWKLHARKPEAFGVDFRHCEKVSNKLITSAQFANGRGNCFIASFFDCNKLNIYRIAKKS
uniref:Uncharacterized protein n=1 Tax=Panagrolaimus sp. JU765 TaxID=591449 RepID=A0AC34QTC0_9BILA